MKVCLDVEVTSISFLGVKKATILKVRLFLGVSFRAVPGATECDLKYFGTSMAGTFLPFNKKVSWYKLFMIDNFQ